MPTPVPSEEQQSLAKPLYERPSWHYIIFSISAYAVGQILPSWFSPAQLATISPRRFNPLFFLPTLVLYIILGWLPSPYKRDLRAIVAGTGIFLLSFFAQANWQVNSFQEAQTALAFAATQTARPTFTQGPTSTATLLPKFAAATEDARIARDLASTETAFQAAQAATATYIGSFNLIDFRELRDYPANHIGEKVCLRGRVFNVNPPTEFQMYVGDTYDDAYIVTDTEFSKLYQDDLVYICGISADNKTFQNALGAQVSTPLIEHAFFR